MRWSCHWQWYVAGWVPCGQFFVCMSVQQHTGSSCRQLSGNGMREKCYSHPCADWDVCFAWLLSWLCHSHFEESLLAAKMAAAGEDDDAEEVRGGTLPLMLCCGRGRTANQPPFILLLHLSRVTACRCHCTVWPDSVWSTGLLPSTNSQCACCCCCCPAIVVAVLCGRGV